MGTYNDLEYTSKSRSPLGETSEYRLQLLAWIGCVGESCFAEVRRLADDRRPFKSGDQESMPLY